MFSVLDFFKGVISSRQHWGKVFDSCRVAEEEVLVAMVLKVFASWPNAKLHSKKVSFPPDIV